MHQAKETSDSRRNTSWAELSWPPLLTYCAGWLGVCGVVAVVAYFFVDERAAYFFRAYQETPFRGLVSMLSKAGDSAWYVIGGAVGYVLLRWWYNVWAARSAYLFVSVVATGLAAKAVKYLVGRPRPRIFLEEGDGSFRWLETDWQLWSMPSGHAATIASVAMVLAVVYPRFRIPILACGIVLCFGRVVTLDHFVSDVVAGIAIGAVGALLLSKCFTLRDKNS
ncbi:MAG: phosphatase PAP2 family protein [Candidatus Hydrogenedentes bacterium]|nr:phosphatase PAP2 family protein [Candidatus Hydrogenedentota bacterium]